MPVSLRRWSGSGEPALVANSAECLWQGELASSMYITHEISGSRCADTWRVRLQPASNVRHVYTWQCRSLSGNREHGNEGDLHG